MLPRRYLINIVTSVKFPLRRTMVTESFTAVIAETTSQLVNSNGTFPFHLKESKLSPNEFLVQYPPGAYTACRTLGHTSIVEFDSHMTRMSNSIKDYDFTNGVVPGTMEELSAKFKLYKEVESLKKILVPMMRD
ncbi:hypothetical protein K7432_013312, partial [Basidiobolus ranarum]